jgi:hypothetical protein
MSGERLHELAPIAGLAIVLGVCTVMGRLFGVETDVSVWGGLIAGIGSAVTLESENG